ncbi:ABC transporter ATP-binding protein [Nocardioides mangrovicus]|uniref:ABC transporter ATP-binding protein n=2 Tax=Nocardioides mangrovicus TaxID=2478913 RepID=A0A3L8P0X9_9ACTN|nr:ABC transporter ATP-binding protein [Nocardioides mangrovicus]RLV48249.1 ABC transporter ATP-binding protein [Nocardioides mangrovicus]
MTTTQQQTGSQQTALAASARDLVRTYGSGETAVTALAGVDLDVAAGRFTAIMGPSGSGKSTLMHCLAGLDTPTSGSVVVGGVELAGLDDTRLTLFRREHVGFVFQSFNLLPMLTAGQNIVLPLELAGTPVDRVWLDDVVGVLGIEDRMGHRPSELSGGQQQRVAVARALISRPDIVFADEPTGNLDSATSLEVLAFLRRSVRELGQSVVMVTHDADAAAHADEVVVIEDGRVA